jgi:iron complex outermembrane receptor protein
VEYIYRFSQNRIAVYETPTPGYNLLNAGLVFQIKSGSNSFETTAGIKNVLNASYIDHLSRFKGIGINNAGINVYLSLKWKFQKNKK